MYLSRIEINPFRHKTMGAIDSPQIMHACVMNCLPAASLQENRVLWRIDRLASSTYLLVQSACKPDFNHIIDQMGWPSSEQQWDTVDYEPLLAKLQIGQNWRFRLKANPTRRISNEKDDELAGKVVHQITAEQQKQWLIDKSSKCGFSIPFISDSDVRGFDIKQRDVKKFNRGGNVVTINMVTFEGVLTIEDLDLFKETIRKGVGRAKAYGCGMITLAREYEQH